MIDPSFTVLHDDNGSFVDYSFQCKDFNVEEFGLELVAAEDYLYVGFEKKFNNFFIAMNIPVVATNTLAAEYWNGSAWVSLTILDESKGMNQSGFIKWNRPKDNQGNHIWEATTINSIELFWIRFKPSADHDVGTKVQGLNILFSNDNDLIAERSNIVSKFAPTVGNVKTWLYKTEAAKKDIVQRLRNEGNRKWNYNDNNPQGTLRFKDVNAFDLHDISQVRQASKYLVLSKIFKQELSDRENDKYFLIGLQFEQLYKDALQNTFFSLDTDDDGEDDSNEQLNENIIKVIPVG